MKILSGLISFFLLALPGIKVLADVPPVLDYSTVLQLARENNYSLRQADAQREEAYGQTLTARSGRLPRLDVIAGYQRTDENRIESFGGNSFGDNQSWSADIQATQPLYTGGAVSSRIASAEAGEAAIEAAYEQVLHEVILNVQGLWYGVLLAREEIKVRESSIDLLEKQLTIAQDEYETGAVSKFELLRSQVAFANGKPPLIRAKNQYRLAVVDLLRALGLEAQETEVQEIRGELGYTEVTYELAECLLIARRNRPEYRVLEKEIEVQERGVNIAKAGKRPNLNFVAGYGIQKSAFSDNLDDTIHGWTVGLQGSWSIWDGQGTKGEVISAQARLRQSELAENDLDLQVGSEVRRSLSSVQEAKELVEASKKVVEQAMEALTIAEDRYSVGSAIQIDVLAAQVSLTEAQTNEIQALYDYNLAIARLQNAMGVLKF